jgi:hypothetical protein
MTLQACIAFSAPLAQWLKRPLIIGIAFLLASCATAAQREYQAIRTGNQSLAAQAKACTEQAYNAPEAAILRPHFPLDLRDVTLAQLSDQSMATRPEADAVLAVYPRLQSCRKAMLDGLQNTTPSIIPILAKDFAEADDDTVALVQRKMTWGDRVRRGRDRLLALQSALSVEGQRITGGLEQQHEAELARRQAALDALARWAQTQQVINAMNRPVITNCMNLGTMTNCVSQ